jgi:hypothetical protein
MHKKKVEEIRSWLELQAEPGPRRSAPRVLVLTGGALCARLLSDDGAIHAKPWGWSVCASTRPGLLLQGLLGVASRQLFRCSRGTWALTCVNGRLPSRPCGMSTGTTRCDSRSADPWLPLFHSFCSVFLASKVDRRGASNSEKIDQMPLVCAWQTDGSLPYASKLDEFEVFVAHSKLSRLALQPSLPSAQPPDLSQRSPQPSQTARDLPGVSACKAAATGMPYF